MGPTKPSGHTPGRGAPSRALRRCAWGVPCLLALLLLLGLLGPSELLLEAWDSDTTTTTTLPSASQALRSHKSQSALATEGGSDTTTTATTPHTPQASQSAVATEEDPLSEALPEPEPISVPESLSASASQSVVEAATGSERELLSGATSEGAAAGAAGAGAEGAGGDPGTSGASLTGEAAAGAYRKQSARPCLEDDDPSMADVAVVLVGQLRRFEASGPSLLRWLLAPPLDPATPSEQPQENHKPQDATTPHRVLKPKEIHRSQGHDKPQEFDEAPGFHTPRRSLVGSTAKGTDIGVTRSSSEDQSMKNVGTSSSVHRGGSSNHSTHGTPQGTMQGTPQGTQQGQGATADCSQGTAEGLAPSSRSCRGQCWFSTKPGGSSAEGGGSREVLDLFVVTSLDENTFKLLGLLLPLPDQIPTPGPEPEPGAAAGAPGAAGPWRLQRPPTLGFLSVAVLPDFTVDASKYPADKLYGLEHGPQGLLRQFQMEARALERVRAHEQQGRGGRAYRWILKTRPDTFWSGPPPSLAQLPAKTPAAGAASAPGKRAAAKISGAARSIIYAPVGLDFGGINDRLALGPSEAMGPVFSRLALLWKASRLWPGSAYKSHVLNAELVLRLALEGVYGHNTSVARARLPFCLLSRRDWMLMRSIAHQHPSRGGDYCRPCTTAQGSPGLCASKGDWESDWERLYDAAVGAPQAHHRALLVSLPMQGPRCQQLIQQMEALVQGPGSKTGPAGARRGTWDAPPGPDICSRRTLGPVQSLGPHKNPGASWPLALDLLRRRCFGNAGCVIYSQGGQAAPARGTRGHRLSPESLPFRWELMLLCALTLPGQGDPPGPAARPNPLRPNPQRVRGTLGTASASALASNTQRLNSSRPLGKATLGAASASNTQPLGSHRHASGSGGLGRRSRRLRAMPAGGGPLVTLVSPEAAQSVLRGARRAASLPLRVGSRKFSRQQAEGVVRRLGVADRTPKGSSVWETMRRLHHTSVDLLKLGADEVDLHVRSWHTWTRTPPVCQLLLHVGTRPARQAHVQRQPGPGGAPMESVPPGEPLAWETLLRWLGALGLRFDQCAAGPGEAQGRCLFYNPDQCAFQ